MNLLERNALYERLENQKIEIERLCAALQRLATFEAFTVEGWGGKDAEVAARVDYARKALGLPGDAP